MINARQSFRVIILAVIFLATLSVTVFLAIKYRQQLAFNRQVQKITEVQSFRNQYPPPYLNTFGLRDGRVGKPYSETVFATFVGAHQNLEMMASDLPKGLSLGDCQSKYDVGFIPTPNTQLICVISGIPGKAGVYNISITVQTPTPGTLITSANFKLVIIE